MDKWMGPLQSHPGPAWGQWGGWPRALPEGLTSRRPAWSGSKLINSPGSSAGQMAWGDAAGMGWGSPAVATAVLTGGGAFGGGTCMCAEGEGQCAKGNSLGTGEGLGF